MTQQAQTIQIDILVSDRAWEVQHMYSLRTIHCFWMHRCEWCCCIHVHLLSENRRVYKLEGMIPLAYPWWHIHARVLLSLQSHKCVQGRDVFVGIGRRSAAVDCCRRADFVVLSTVDDDCSTLPQKVEKWDWWKLEYSFGLVCDRLLITQHSVGIANLPSSRRRSRLNSDHESTKTKCSSSKSAKWS